jgi:O-antigen ligase
VPKIIISLPTVAVVLLALSLTWQPAREVLTRTAARVASTVDPAESSNRIRLDLWRVGLTIATEHPVLGTGPDSYVIVFPRYRDQVLSPDRAAHMAQFRPESPHNVYIAVAAGQGIPALVAYLIIIGSSLVLGVRAARSKIPMPTRLALAALVGAVVVNLVTESFMTAEPASTAIFWVVLGSLAGLASGIVNGSAAMEQP